MTGFSRGTVTRLFEKEPGVITLRRPEQLHKRRYSSIRIPRTVIARVLSRMGGDADAMPVQMMKRTELPKRERRSTETAQGHQEPQPRTDAPLGHLTREQFLEHVRQAAAARKAKRELYG